MLSLFSGIGGIDLAAQWAGIETMAFCEIDPFCQKILRKHWPGVKIYDDVRSVNRGTLQKDGIRTIDIVTGGFPCQDLSVAGKRAGLIGQNGKTTRSGLWFNMLDIIEEIRPKWVVGENVAGLLSHNEGRTFDTILTGLEDIGYEVLPVVSSASNYGASFEGKRVFVIATSKSSRYGGSSCQKLKLSRGSWSRMNTKGVRYGVKLKDVLWKLYGLKKPSPMIYEAIMGFPIGWTELSA